MQSLMTKIAGARLLAAMALLAMTIGGLFAFRSMPVDAFPDVTPTLVQVFTETEGLPAEDVERYVTVPVEAAMAGLPRLERTRSVSNFGLSVVNLYFEDGTDIYFARQAVSERLGQARSEIPEGFGEPAMGPVSTGLGIVLYFRIRDLTGERSLVELREIQDWVVKRQLETVKGVTEVLALGGYEKEIQVRVQPQALQRHGLAIGDVVTAIERGNGAAGAQFIEVGSEQYTVRGLGLVQSPAEIEGIPVTFTEGLPVRVGDVATVGVGGAVRQGLATADGKGEVVAGLVLKLQGANTSEVIERVRERFRTIQQSLPDGIVAEPYYDQATLVGLAASTVTTALWQGAILVAIVVVAFLGGWRPSLVVVGSIPFSVGFAFIAMQVLGISANLMSLGGVAIAIGMMVDGAIVIAENVDQRLRKQPGRAGLSLVGEAAAEVMGPLVAAVSVVIVVFLPLFALEGVEGKTFRPLAAAAALAMTGSLIYAGLVAPALSGLVMRSRPAAGTSSEDPGWLGRRVAAATSVFVRARWMAFALAVVLLAAGGLAASRLGSEFTPTLEEGDILARVTMAPSISLTEATATMTRIEARLMAEMPEIQTIVTRIGRGEVGAHADPTNNAESFIALKPRKDWRADKTAEDLRADISAVLAAIPGVTATVGQPVAMSVDELITGSRAELAVKVFGPDSAILGETTAELAEVLEGVRGASDVQADQTTGTPQLVVSVDREAMGRYGLDVQDVLGAVSSSIGGVQAGVMFEGARSFPITVRYAASDRQSVEAVERVILRGRDGALAPVSAVARVSTVIGPRQIAREDGERFSTVQANVRGRDIGSFVAEAKAAVEDRMTLPPGYRLAWGGQFELQQRANARFALVIPVTLGVVVLILLLTFGRLASAALILLNIPLALTGGAVALWLAGLPLSVPATVGFIALFGIALGNGMVLVSFMDAFARAGRPLNALAVEAAGLRARAVLMTALTTALGLAPLLFATGVGSEVQRPLAVVVAGGLITSTVLTLLVLPPLHRWFAPRAGRVDPVNPER